MSENSSLNHVTDIVSTLVDGVPAPIKRNFFKAIGQLGSAAMDIPIAWLEGKSGIIRATNQARIQIIKTEGDKFSEQVEIPQNYIDRASEKYASKIIREQINLDVITHKAAEELANENFEDTEFSEKEISDDWLNEFENTARQMSSEEMKFIFAKILANETKNPGNFSIRTLRIISQLDNQAATIFQKLCSCAISLEYEDILSDVRVVSLEGSASSNSLKKYGLSFKDLNVLHEYGLIISDYNSYMQYAPSIVDENNSVMIATKFVNNYYAFLPTDREKYDKTLKFDGVAFTKSGKELFNIVPKEINNEYKKDFEEFLIKKTLKLVSVNVN